MMVQDRSQYGNAFIHSLSEYNKANRYRFENIFIIIIIVSSMVLQIHPVIDLIFDFVGKKTF
jgi:hypothetical protein